MKNKKNDVTKKKRQCIFSPIAMARRPLSLSSDRRQLITLNVHLCVQHDARDGARSAGSFAVSDSVSVYWIPAHSSLMSNQQSTDF